jgi:hypothetical protein
MNGCCVDKCCDKDTCMTLPEGESCATCCHSRRCTAIFGATLTDTSCQFYPRRFTKRQESEAAHEDR